MKVFLRIFSIFYALFFCTNALSVIRPINWEEPFLEAVERLRLRMWEHSPVTQKSLEKDAKKIMAILKDNREDWLHLIEPQSEAHMGLEMLNTLRSAFQRRPYVNTVFPTKMGTLVFQASQYPHIVKIDNRAAELLDAKYRSYLDAFEKTQMVQSQIEAVEIDHLYLPIEFAQQWTLKLPKKPATSANKFTELLSDGRNSPDISRRQPFSDEARERTFSILFSENLPLFSDAELDHRVLLNLLLTYSINKPDLRNALRTMYMQAIAYICSVDFDDINYRNMPFMVDGRLAPFDTDSLLANTGVATFMRMFFAYKLISLNAAKATIKRHCKEPYASNPENIKELFHDHDLEDQQFEHNNAMIEAMAKYVTVQETEPEKRRLADFVTELKYAPYTTVFDNMIASRLYAARRQNAHIFGQRCVHITDFVMELSRDFATIMKGNLSVEEKLAHSAQEIDNIIAKKTEDLIENLLRSASFSGIIYIKAFPSKHLASGDKIPFMKVLSSFKDLRSFMCF